MAEYIEREAAMLQIDAADFVRDDNFEGGATLLFCDDVVDRLSAIPAADVREVTRSHWFDGACVNCGFKPKLDYEYATVYDRWGGYAWNFCPNCGADMRDGE